MIPLNTSRFLLSASLLPICMAMTPATVYAQDTGTEEVQSKDPHDRGEILVSAEGLENLDFIAGQTTLDSGDIQRNLSGQLGEVLAKVPGVSATSFGPGASRPILRGQDGERVRVLIDGIGTADIANTSADHATTIDPLTAERIEVLRGPAALLYGSQAIGGVVNVIDKRIPIAIPENGFHVDALFAGDTASNLRSGGISVDAGIGSDVVLHFDGSYRDTGDLEIPGFQVTDALRADLLGDAQEEEDEGELDEAEELREAANRTGFVPNTSTETYTLNGGLAVFMGESSFGASIGYYDTFYGIPGNPDGGHHGEEEGGAEEEEGEETVSIGLEQWRFDFRGDIVLGGGFFERLKLRGGFSDYTHTEFEGTEVGTVFDTETIETRAELLQKGGGVIGVQYISRDFQAVGEEAFVAPNDTTQLSIFTAQEFDFGGFEIEAAGRYENVNVDANTLGLERDFDLLSGAISAVFGSEGGVRFGITGSRSERAPAGEELFANGPHIATQTFEIGDPDLDVESAWGLETFVRGELGGASFGASIFYQQFDDYIYLNPTGQEDPDEELPIFEFLQQDAKFFGFEAELLLPLVERGDFTLTTDLRASYVDAELDDGSAVPRIPPLSLLGAVVADTGPFEARAEVQYFGSQDDVAAFETETDDFTFVNASIAWRPLQSANALTVLLQADNIFDVEGRRHTSFTKEFLPLAGRNFKVSVRTSF